jgi:putative ABC transport system permease protein
MGLLAVEYALVGLLAGLVGSVGAVGLSWVLVTRVMTLSWATDWWAVGFAVGGAAFLVSTVGVLANQRALRVPPAQVLRGE